MIPNYKLISEKWSVVAYDILRPLNSKEFISNVISMAKALGEINRYHSKSLSDGDLFALQKRMTELRKVVRTMERNINRKIIPWAHLEYLFSGEDRKDLKR